MALVKWIDPVETKTGPSARAYFGSAVMPPNLRPAFLHDRGGAGGPQQLLGPKDPGQLGMTADEFLWWQHSGIWFIWVLDPNYPFAPSVSADAWDFPEIVGPYHYEKLPAAGSQKPLTAIKEAYTKSLTVARWVALQRMRTLYEEWSKKHSVKVCAIEATYDFPGGLDVFSNATTGIKTRFFCYDPGTKAFAQLTNTNTQIKTTCPSGYSKIVHDDGSFGCIPPYTPADFSGQTKTFSTTTPRGYRQPVTTVAPMTVPSGYRPPAFVRGGPSALGALPDAGVGAPYDLEYWTYYFYLNGVFMGKTGPHLRTHSDGYAGITQACNSWITNPPPGLPASSPYPVHPGFQTTPYKAVCGSYTKTNILMQPVSYCTYDGVKTTIGNYTPPPPNPTPLVYPFPFTAFIRRSIPLSPFGTQPFGGTTVTTTQFQTRITRPPVPFLFGPGEGRLGDVTDSVAYKTCMNQRQQQCVSLNPGADGTPGSPGYSAWVALNVCIQAADLDCKAKASGAVGPGGQDVSGLQTQINNALGTQNICPIGVDGKLGPTTCTAAAYVQQNIDSSVNIPPSCGAILANSSSSAFDPDCKTGGGGTPPPPPPCTPTSCGPTQDCFGTKCVDKCPTGYKRADDGSCVTAATTAGIGGGAGLGWLLGIGAAVGAIFLGMRAPNLPKQPARAARARSQKRRRSAPKRRRAAA